MLIKRLGVAAAMMLCAFGAFASNFRGADQVYLPVAGHLEGSTGTFISDVYISNLSSDAVDVSVIYQPIGANVGGTPPIGTDFDNVIHLDPLERKEFPDFFSSGLGLSSGFGQLIFNGCLADASCGPETQDEDGFSENFRSISVESRIYQVAKNAPPGSPTSGQLFSGIPWYNFVSSLQSNAGLDKVFITGVTHTGNGGTAGTFRANFGFVNASQYSSTQILVRLYQGRLRTEDLKGEATVDLGPLGNTQLGFAALFPSAAFGSNYFVTVEQRNNVPTSEAPATCTQGCPAFLAYGSVLDNISGDATTLESQYLIEMNPEALLVLYPSGSGKLGIRRGVRH